ncbi:MAG: hypothetical protein QOG03_1255, partial [Actinomycetota bacterium]|nr:hypothetical protein [Actinomycetota bacterium]
MPGSDGPASRPASLRLGTVAALVTGVVYMIGSSRPFGYDASVTVARFVATPSLLDALRRQDVFNNHVLFSLAEHVVYSLTGSRSEVVLRLLPVAAAAGVVGLTAVMAARRWGLVAGAVAAVVVAANPTFAAEARDVRGYSMVVLAALVSTLILLSLMRSEGDPSLPRRAAYVAVSAVGVGVHLSMALVLLAHLAAAVAHRHPRRLGILPMASVLMGSLFYAGVAGTMLAVRHDPRFRPGFARQLLSALGGAQGRAFIGPVVVIGLVLLARDLRARVALATLVVSIGWVWLVAKPYFLYPRFFVWLVLATAAAAAAAVARWPALVAPLALGVALAIPAQARAWGRAQVPNRRAADVVAGLHRPGPVCSLGASLEPLDVYLRTRR